MLDWFKKKINRTTTSAAADVLREQFAFFENIPGAGRNLVEHLTQFVLTGEGESVLADLAAIPGARGALPINLAYYGSYPNANVRSVLSVLEALPQDLEIYLRLARAYAAAEYAGMSVSQPFSLFPIPAFDGSLLWLGSFLVQLSEGGKERSAIFPATVVSEMVKLSGEDPSALVKGAFFYEDAQGKSQLNRWSTPPYSFFQCLEGFNDLVVQSADLVRPAFRQKEAGSRATVLRALGALEVSPEPFAAEVASLAVSGSKEVREAAFPLVSPLFSTFKDLLERCAEKGSSDERCHAVRLLARLGGAAEDAFLAHRLETEKTAKVIDAIKSELSNQSSQQTTTEVDEYDFPPVPEVPVNAPLDRKVLNDLRDRLQEEERKIAAANNNQFSQQWTRVPISSDTADKLFAALQTFVVRDADKCRFFKDSGGVDFHVLCNYSIPPQFQLIHLIRYCLLLSEGQNRQIGVIDQWTLGHLWSRPILSYQKVQKRPIDLRELAAVFRTLGLDDQLIGRQILQTNRYSVPPFLRTDPDKIWPYFAERLDLIEIALGMKAGPDESTPYQYIWEAEQRANAFGILKLFPRLPARFVPMLWDLALGGGKIDRAFAQECLATLNDKEDRIVAALASRQQDSRLAAAQWLGVLGHTPAVPALRAALAKEKSETVKDELIKTLELLGVKLEELLDLDKLDQEAAKGLQKGIPNDLDWFPFAQLPAVRWVDSGNPVPTSVLHWFIVQGYKLKNAEANPTLRRYCSLFEPDDRVAFGKFVMDAWIEKDTRPKYSAEEAARMAQNDARQTAASARQYPQYYPEFDEQRTYQAYFNSYLVQPEGSQNSTKGILAVAGACCSGDAAPTVHRYIKQWYGYRAAQCKALLQVLSWIDHPSATQVVLSVANRFRTKGIQEEAMRQCQLLAERKGWTLDELADRTIPTAGFDESGKLELDYGGRKFTGNLSEEMAIVLTNQTGKTISSLPDPNQSDDPALAKEAKAALSNARKELKSILTMQKDRLYEALCTQREWLFEDWDTYLRQHPIVGRYCQRLVWVAYDGEKIVASFRPLGDGTLTNHEDDEVKLEAGSSVRLGHDETLGVDDRTAWLQHFSDYKVDPLFQQFGKVTFKLTDDQKDSTEINDFLGHLVKAYTLRNRLTRLGYTRGAAQDAGWFYDYRKTFLRLGIESVIEFTGNSLPEENRTIALQRLYFARKFDGANVAAGQELTLGELPRVLLAECWNDMRMAAVEGSGFAADWEKQTEIR
jgi:hypothetical protein